MTRVAGIVAACSDAVAVPGQPKAPWRGRKEAYLARLREQDNPQVLLASACDKLRNARAIVADPRQTGPVLRDRFSQHDPAAHLWYYQALADCYTGRVPEPLAGELHRVITQMQSLAGPLATRQG